MSALSDHGPRPTQVLSLSVWVLSTLTSLCSALHSMRDPQLRQAVRWLQAVRWSGACICLSVSVLHACDATRAPLSLSLPTQPTHQQGLGWETNESGIHAPLSLRQRQPVLLWMGARFLPHSSALHARPPSLVGMRIVDHRMLMVCGSHHACCGVIHHSTACAVERDG